jgi:very-short-patch-repair endonuclease
VGDYIADFLCHECRLVVELDGDSHDGRENYDLKRTMWFESQGFKVIRFTNFDVLENLESVVEVIRKTDESES